MVQHGQPIFRLARPWSGIHPQLAVTLLSDAMLRAERDVNLRDACSRVRILFRCEPGQAA
jgi:hypothetical protein